MESSSWKYVGKKLSVHLTSLTDEDIDRIRCQLEYEATKKGNKVSKAKARKKKSSNSQPFGATASSKNRVSESAIDNLFLQTRLQKTALTRIKGEPISSSKCSEKQKRPPNLRSSKVSSKKFFVDARTPVWNDCSSCSSSDESESEEVLMPEKILIKPSAQFISPKLSQSDTAPETHIRATPQGIELNIPPKFPIRQPIVLLKKISLDVDMKPEICDTISYNRSVLVGNSSDTTVQVKTISSGSDKEDSESEEYADEKPLQRLIIADQLLEHNEPSILENGATQSKTKSENATTATEHAPPRCSCQSTVAPAETITTAVQTKTKASFQTSLLTNELAEASSQNTLSLKNVTTRERNESDAICSPVIFDEESQATRDFRGEVSSPVIFGSNEGTAAESGDARDRSNNQFQDESSDSCDSSSNFVLELSMDEQSAVESASKNGAPTCDASQNFDLQLSETISHQSSVNSPELFSSCSLGLDMPSNVAASSDSRNFQPFSRLTNVSSSRAKPISSLSDGEASSNLSRNLTERENNGQFMKDVDFSGNKKVPSSTPKNETHSKSNAIWCSAVKPSNRSDNQEVLVHSVRSLNPERQKILFLRKAENLFDGSKNDSSTVKDPSSSRSQKSPLFTTNASRVMENWRSYLSGLVVPNTSNPKRSSSVMESPSLSKSKRICLSVSQAANLATRQSAYLLPLKHLNPSSHQKCNLLSKEGTKLPDSAPISSCTDAFTQMDFHKVQQPSQLNVNYIINTPSLKTIQFKGPVVNHPSAITAISKSIPVRSSILAPETHHCPRDFSPNQAERIPYRCFVGHCFRRSEVIDLLKSGNQLEKSSTAFAFATTKLPAGSSNSVLNSEKLAVRREGYKESRVLASRMTTDSINLTGDDEPKCEDPSSGRIRLKTPTELGCTIAFTDDVERLFRHELPKLQSNSNQLELLKEKHYNLFKVVPKDDILWKSVGDTLQELYSTRRVPSGSHLMRPSPSARLSSVQMCVKSAASSNSTGS